MRLHLYSTLIIVMSTFLYTCTEQETETKIAGCAGSGCGSKAEMSEGCAGCPSAHANEVSIRDANQNAEMPKITFVELGSEKCIPCKQMKHVMKAIEEKYGPQIEVIFYDVWKSDQKKYATEYEIRLIPTQVFLNQKGQELFRHEGFFPEEEIDIFLQAQGLKPIRKS